MQPDRRTVFAASAAFAIPAAAAPPSPVTRILANYAVSARAADIPAPMKQGLVW